MYNVRSSSVVFGPAEQEADISQWVRRTLTLEGIVVNKHRPKHNFTDRDLKRVYLTLWSRDDLIYISERYRVQTTFIISVYCWTGARIGAFFTDGLRYKVGSKRPLVGSTPNVTRISHWFYNVSTAGDGDSSTRSTSGG